MRGTGKTEASSRNLSKFTSIRPTHWTSLGGPPYSSTVLISYSLAYAAQEGPETADTLCHLDGAQRLRPARPPPTPRTLGGKEVQGIATGIPPIPQSTALAVGGDVRSEADIASPAWSQGRPTRYPTAPSSRHESARYPMSRRCCAPAKPILSTAAYALSAAWRRVSPLPVTPRTRPPAVTMVPSGLSFVPA